MSSRQTFTSEVILNALEKTDNHPTAATNCNVDESGNFQKPLKMTSLKQIYLQIEKNIYTGPHSLSNALTHRSQTH